MDIFSSSSSCLNVDQINTFVQMNKATFLLTLTTVAISHLKRSDIDLT